MRNGRRAVFSVAGDVRLNGAPVTTGAQLAQELIVGADVLHAADAALPAWARAGQERLRAPIS
jgi:hypothetical protein